MTHRRSSWLASHCLALLVGCHAARPEPASLGVPLPAVALTGHDTIAPGVLRGKVQATLPGYSVAQTLVRLDGGTIETRADSLGRFEFRGVAPGRHQLEARRLPLRPTLGAIEMPTNRGAVLRITLEPVTVCLDYCAPEQPRAFGALDNVP